MKYLNYFFNVIIFTISIITCIWFGGLMCIGIYKFTQDLNLIDNNLTIDFVAIIIGYIFFKLSWLTIKRNKKFLIK